MKLIISAVLFVVCFYFFISVYTSYSDYRKKINSELESNKIIKRFYVKSSVFIVSATAFVALTLISLYRSWYVIEKTFSSKELSDVQLNGFLSVICTFLFAVSFVVFSYCKIMKTKAKHNNDAKLFNKLKTADGFLIAALVVFGVGVALFFFLFYMTYYVAKMGELFSGGFPTEF